MFKKYLLTCLTVVSLLNADSLSVYIDLNPEEFMVKGTSHSASSEQLLNIDNNFTIHLDSNSSIYPAYKITKSSVLTFNSNTFPENHTGRNSNVIIYSNDNLPMRRGYIYSPEFMKMLSINIILDSMLAIADSNGVVPDSREYILLYNKLFNKFSKRNFYFTYSRRLAVVTDYYKTVLSSILNAILKDMLNSKDQQRLLSISGSRCIVDTLNSCGSKSEAINTFLSRYIDSHNSHKFKSYADFKLHLPDKVRVVVDNIIYIYKLVEAADKIVTNLGKEFDYEENSIKYINYIIDPRDYFSFFSIYPRDNYSTVYISNDRLIDAKHKGFFNYTEINRQQNIQNLWSYGSATVSSNCLNVLDPTSDLIQKKGVKVRVTNTNVNGYNVQKIDYLLSGNPYYTTISYPTMTENCISHDFSVVKDSDVIDLFKYVYNSIYNEVLSSNINSVDGFKGLKDLFIYNDMLLNIYVTVKDSYITPAIDSLISKSFLARTGDTIDFSEEWRDFFDSSRKEGDWHLLNYIKMYTIDENGVKDFPVTFDILGLHININRNNPPEAAKEKPDDQNSLSVAISEDIEDIAKGKVGQSDINKVKSGYVYIVFLNKFKDYSYTTIGTGKSISDDRSITIGGSVAPSPSHPVVSRINKIINDNRSNIGVIILCSTNTSGEIIDVLDYKVVDETENGGRYLLEKVLSLADPSILQDYSEEDDSYKIDTDRLEEAYRTLFDLFRNKIDVTDYSHSIFSGVKSAKIVAFSRDLITSYHFGGTTNTIDFLKSIAGAVVDIANNSSGNGGSIPTSLKFEDYFINPLKITDVKTYIDVIQADYEFDDNTCDYKDNPTLHVRYKCSITMKREYDMIDIYSATEFARVKLDQNRPAGSYYIYNLMMYDYGGKEEKLVNNVPFYTSSVSIIGEDDYGQYKQDSIDDCMNRYRDITYISGNTLYRDKNNHSFNRLTVLQNRYRWSECQILPDPGSDEYSLVYNIIKKCKKQTNTDPFQALYSNISSLITEFYLTVDADSNVQSHVVEGGIPGSPPVPDDAPCNQSSSSQSSSSGG